MGWVLPVSSRCPRAQGAWTLSCLYSQIPLHWGSLPYEPPSPVSLTPQC